MKLLQKIISFFTITHPPGRFSFNKEEVVRKHEKMFTRVLRNKTK